MRDLLNLNAQFVDWAWSQTPKTRLQHAGWTEYCFDDTEIEVCGKKMEGARINYEGNLALSWQVLWKGPFVLDHQLEGAPEFSEHLPGLLVEHQHRWQGERSCFSVDSDSSGARYVNTIDQAGFTRWSVSYNKWTEKLEKLAAALPESAWSGAPTEPGATLEQYAWVRHQPGGLCPHPRLCRGATPRPRRTALPLRVRAVRIRRGDGSPSDLRAAST